MPRSGAFRRHQRRRLIRKRTKILLNVWQTGFSPYALGWKWLDTPGRLGKSNLKGCSCPGCSPWKYDRPAGKAEARRLTREQIDDR